MKENIYKVIDLLSEKSKSKITYKEISKLTGYHEKSLIRINKELKKHGRELMLKKIGSKYHYPISSQEEKYIVDVILSCNKTGLKRIYQFYIKRCKEEKKYCERSFSAIYSLMIKNNLVSKRNKNVSDQPSKLISKNTVIFKVIKLPKKNAMAYIAIDLGSSEIIRAMISEEREIEICARILSHIIENHGVPDVIYCFGSLLLRKPVYGQTQFARMCEELNIAVEYDHDENAERAFKLHKNKAITDQKEVRKIKYKKLNEKIKLDDIICIKQDRKVLQRNMVQFENGLYEVLVPKKMSLVKGTKVKVFMDFHSKGIRVLFNNKIYETKLILIKTSKKFYE